MHFHPLPSLWWERAACILKSGFQRFALVDGKSQEKKKDVFDLLLNSGDITKTLSGFISSEYLLRINFMWSIEQWNESRSSS